MFTKKNTLQIKGIAAIFMLCHHLFFFHERIPINSDTTTGIVISQWDLIDIIGAFGKLCVALFMFLGGYGLYCSYESTCKDSSGEKAGGFLLKRIIRLYKGYWKVFLIFIPIGFLFFNNQQAISGDDFLAGAFSHFDMKNVIVNFSLAQSNINREWWFYKAYLFALFLSLVFIQMFRNKKKIYVEFFTVTLFIMVTRCVLPFLANREGLGLRDNFWYSNMINIDESAVVMMSGVIFAKYSVFKGWRGMLERFSAAEKLIIALVSIAAMAYMRTFILPIYTDVFTAPLFITAALLITDTFRPVGAAFSFVGKYSTGIWLTHTFYCYYFIPFARFIYRFDSPIAAFLITFVLSLVTAILLELFWKYLFIGLKKDRRKLLDLCTGKGIEEAPDESTEAEAPAKEKAKAAAAK